MMLVFSFWKTHDFKPNESQTKIKMSQCGMCIFTQLQKCSCPVQIVKSRDNSPADELDLCFIGCPEGLQFQNRRKLSRRNSDCSTNSKLHTPILITVDECERGALSSTWSQSKCSSHSASCNPKQNIVLTWVKHGNRCTGIQMLCFTWE